MRSTIIVTFLLAGVASAPLVLPVTPEADANRSEVDRSRTAASTPSPPPQGDHGFRFVRVRYESTSGGWGRRRSWATDYPAAEEHLHEAIERTTGLYIEGSPIVLEATDERIFEYPVLYLTEPGFWRTNDEEVEALKKYLERGGFLIIDDFHDYGRGRVGPQWNNMYDNIKQIFPDREPEELTKDHPIWSVYYDIDPDAALSTKIGERAGNIGFGPLDDIYYGVFDDDGRMVMAICYNQDIGDGWEHPTVNLADISTISFQMGINIILYALTH